MNLLLISLFFINFNFTVFMKPIVIIILMLYSATNYSQVVKQDSLFYKDVYGIRLGFDISNPIQTLFNNKRKSIELVADYRLSKKYFLAAEIGFLDNTINENYYDLQTKGQYIKLGANYNLYKNFLDMENEVYLGLRYGFSFFNHKVSKITINSDIILPENHLNNTLSFTDLNAHWGELIIGMKVAVYENVFLGVSAGFKRLITDKEPDNFKNIYMPGFNRVYLNNGGFTFNYTIMYRLPLYKKNKIDKIEDVKSIEKK